MWQRLGHTTTIAYAPWPVHDEAKLKTDTITLAVQVNGKKRGEITVAADASKDSIIAAAQSDEKVAPFLAGKQLSKPPIYVPGRLVNFVV